MQIDFIAKIIVNHPLISVKLYQVINYKQCKISTNKHLANKKITHDNILLKCHLLIYIKIISLYDCLRIRISTKIFRQKLDDVIVIITNIYIFDFITF